MDESGLLEDLQVVGDEVHGQAQHRFDVAVALDAVQERVENLEPRRVGEHPERPGEGGQRQTPLSFHGDGSRRIAPDFSCPIQRMTAPSRPRHPGPRNHPHLRPPSGRDDSTHIEVYVPGYPLSSPAFSPSFRCCENQWGLAAGVPAMAALGHVQAASAGNQWRVRLQTLQTESMTGTSTRTPTTVARAAPDPGP